MADTQKLKDMLDDLINGKSEQAQTIFHQYLKDKVQDVFGKEIEPLQTTPKVSEE